MGDDDPSKSIFCGIVYDGKNVVDRYIYSTKVSATFREIYTTVHKELNLEFNPNEGVTLKAEIAAKDTRLDKSLVNVDNTLRTTLELINTSYIDFTVTPLNKPLS